LEDTPGIRVFLADFRYWNSHFGKKYGGFRKIE
jgi:uncharacterized Fe-S radical SAM superfamily protein PflX